MTISRVQGFSGVWEGLLPTAIGYSLQGACKFGFYEYFKHKYAAWAGPELAHTYRTSLYLLASASAEFIADVALCPLEALKVRMQTSVTEPFATTTWGGFRRILAHEGLRG
jgi:solute carrier family 25 (mitochondrial phosphate transporter), member 3